MPGKKEEKKNETPENKECFAIMPIADPEGYPDGHFLKVFEDIITPACEKAGYEAVRADQSNQANIIHIEILNKIIEAPIAVCDLSSRNPNVMFELGIRQAFDKPVVLIQEKGTPRIFDIANINTLDYSKDMNYREVLEIQEKLAEFIKNTACYDGKQKNLSSIIRLLSVTSPASIPVIGEERNEIINEIILNNLHQIKDAVQQTKVITEDYQTTQNKFNHWNYKQISNKILIEDLLAQYENAIENLDHKEDLLSELRTILGTVQTVFEHEGTSLSKHEYVSLSKLQDKIMKQLF